MFLDISISTAIDRPRKDGLLTGQMNLTILCAAYLVSLLLLPFPLSTVV